VIFLSKLHQLEILGADVENACMETLMNEKVYIIGGPEFGYLSGQNLLIYKALYGLRSSGLCWHQHFAKVRHFMGFVL
jgi:hypothetical protein